MTDTPIPEKLNDPIAEPPPAETPGLARKILEIQAAVGTVKKKGKFGTEMGGSNYLRIEDAVFAVGKLMAEKGLILTGNLAMKADGTFFYERMPHTTKGYIANVLVQWRLEDVETTHYRIYYIPGDGYDGTDKAVYKALTGSRKYAIIFIFNLAVGNDVEAHGLAEPNEARAAQKNVAAQKIADAAGKGNKTALDTFSQIEPEKKIAIDRPEAFNGHYIAVSGLIAVPQLEKFFDDTGSKRFKSKVDEQPYWRVPQEYEKGLIELCKRLKIEVEGIERPA